MSLGNSAVATAPALALPPTSTPPTKLGQVPPRYQLRVISLARLVCTSVTRELGLFALLEADRLYIAASLWCYADGQWSTYDLNKEWVSIGRPLTL
jgi:hypothetical protein